HLLATTLTAGQPAADDPLRLLSPVRVGRVEEVDAGIERGIHDLTTRGLVGLRAEVHRAETQGAHSDSGPTQVAILHTRNLTTGSCGHPLGDDGSLTGGR